MAERDFDPKVTVVVSNIPPDVGEDDLTIHFQKGKNGGGDVEDVVLKEGGSIAFVVFDLAEVVSSVLKHNHVIKGKSVQVQSYQPWQKNKKKHDKNEANDKEDSNTTGVKEVRDGVATIYIGGFKDSSTEDAITLFFENKRRSGGGELCPGKDGYKRISPTVARLTFASSKDAENVLKKAIETPLKLDDNILKVSTILEPTHDRSILLAKNLNPETSEETFKNFVEAKKNADVLKVVLGKDRKAIVILKTEIEEDDSDEESSSGDMRLSGSVISLEFAPLTKGIRIKNIPLGTSSDDIKFKFCNPKKGGGKVTDMMLDRKNGIANIYFEEYSVVSKLVKKKHTFKGVPLTVFPYYDDFEVIEEVTTKTAEYSGNYPLEPVVWEFIIIHHEIDKMFKFKSMKYDQAISTLHFSKEFDNSKDAVEFEKQVKEFLKSFHKEEVKIPKGVFNKVKEAIESKRTEFKPEEIDLKFDRYRVILIGKKELVTREKHSVEAMIDKFSEQANRKPEEMEIEDRNKHKLKLLNFIDYFNKIMTDTEEVKIRESASGDLTLYGPPEKIKDVRIRIMEDLLKITEIDVKTSDRQIDFLKRTDCQIANKELKKHDAMLRLTSIKDFVGAKSLQAKIMTLKKCDDNEEKRLVNMVLSKTSEKCITIDTDTAKFLPRSDKLQVLKKEQFEKHQVMIDPELKNPCNIWIVCEESKMNKAEQDLASLTDEKKITSSTFKPMDPMKIRFLKEHCWDKIKEKEHNCRVEGVQVVKSDSDALEVKGTKAGRQDMILFLENLAGKVDVKTFPLNEPGMKKQMSMEITNSIISDIEKNHKCVIEPDIQPEETAKPGDGAAKATSTKMNLPYNSMSFVNDKEVKMATGQKISIVIGDLAQQNIDVIVNTTNDKLDLNANPCGKALLKVAGKELLNECKKIGTLQAGQMASTGPANLKCKRVYHVRSAQWDTGKGASILRQLIKTCLDQVEKDKLTSIAIPAIGTGHLGFPRPEVAKTLLEEVTRFFTANPQSAINDVRFVAYSGDQPTVDAFLAAFQEIKSMISGSSPSKSVPVPAPRKVDKPSLQRPSNVTTTETPDGLLELSLGKNLNVQIVCNDIAKETTDVIMHVTNSEFSFQGGVGKAIIKAGGDDIVTECKAIPQPDLFSTHFTKAGKLNVNQIAHVIGTTKPTHPELKKCLDSFFDVVLQKNIASVSFSAIGAGAMGFSEKESADLIFHNLSKIENEKKPALNLVRIVIFEKPKFIKFKDAARAYFSPSGGAGNSSPQPRKASFSSKLPFKVFGSKKHAKSAGGDGPPGISFKIYSDDRGKIDNVWKDLKRKITQSIKEQPVEDDIIKKFSDGELEKIRKLERDFDVKITPDKNKGRVMVKGHITDIATIQEEIRKILKDFIENESKVPDYWDASKGEQTFLKILLPTNSQEYKNVEAAFRKTAPNQIVSIERIQNKEIYELYGQKKKTMEKKYGKNFNGKELMLFHGTSLENIEPINAGGLNRSYAGIHATYFGRGVYFARDASYSCRATYSPPDSQGRRYMYYAKVLVGEYTAGSPSMIVAPPKDPSNPNETYNSVVDNIAKPSIYVLFKDYEYYTEYLITFR